MSRFVKAAAICALLLISMTCSATARPVPGGSMPGGIAAGGSARAPYMAKGKLWEDGIYVVITKIDGVTNLVYDNSGNIVASYYSINSSDRMSSPYTIQIHQEDAIVACKDRHGAFNLFSFKKLGYVIDDSFTIDPKIRMPDEPDARSYKKGVLGNSIVVTEDGATNAYALPFSVEGYYIACANGTMAYLVPENTSGSDGLVHNKLVNYISGEDKSGLLALDDANGSDGSDGNGGSGGSGGSGGNGGSGSSGGSGGGPWRVSVDMAEGYAIIYRRTGNDYRPAALDQYQYIIIDGNGNVVWTGSYTMTNDQSPYFDSSILEQYGISYNIQGETLAITNKNDIYVLDLGESEKVNDITDSLVLTTKRLIRYKAGEDISYLLDKYFDDSQMGNASFYNGYAIFHQLAYDAFGRYQLYTIFDNNGIFVSSGIGSVNYLGQDLFILRRGRYIGVADKNGEWLVRIIDFFDYNY